MKEALRAVDEYSNISFSACGNTEGDFHKKTVTLEDIHFIQQTAEFLYELQINFKI